MATGIFLGLVGIEMTKVFFFSSGVYDFHAAYIRGNVHAGLSTVLYPSINFWCFRCFH
jgi:hypothetical protein